MPQYQFELYQIIPVTSHLTPNQLSRAEVKYCLVGMGKCHIFDSNPLKKANLCRTEQEIAGK